MCAAGAGYELGDSFQWKCTNELIGNLCVCWNRLASRHGKRLKTGLNWHRQRNEAFLLIAEIIESRGAVHGARQEWAAKLIAE